jgi:hypothetical protein
MTNFLSFYFLVVVSWALGLEAMKTGVSLMDNPDGQHFIDEYALKIIHLMTQQR